MWLLIDFIDKIILAEGSKKAAELQSEGEKIKMTNESEGTLIKIRNESEARKSQLVLEGMLVYMYVHVV